MIGWWEGARRCAKECSLAALQIFVRLQTFDQEASPGLCPLDGPVFVLTGVVETKRQSSVMPLIRRRPSGWQPEES